MELYRVELGSSGNNNKPGDFLSSEESRESTPRSLHDPPDLGPHGSSRRNRDLGRDARSGQFHGKR